MYARLHVLHDEWCLPLARFFQLNSLKSRLRPQRWQVLTLATIHARRHAQRHAAANKRHRAVTIGEGVSDRARTGDLRSHNPTL